MFQKITRIKVQYDTIDKFNTKEYINKNGIKIKIPKDLIDDSVKNTFRLQEETIDDIFKNNLISKYNKINNKATIFIINDDCLDTGLKLAELGYCPVVLNMANAYVPGGGYKLGCSTQEEQLFRRTNLHMCLDYQKKEMYPIPKYGTIYTKNAIVIKDNDAKNYEFLNEIRLMSFIASAAHVCRPHDIVSFYGKKTLRGVVEQDTLQKMHAIFRTGILMNHDSIILSAYGCGAFGNPSNHIAELFKKIIPEYDKYYKFIIFAILDDSNAFKNNEKGNLANFTEIFDLKPISLPQMEKIIMEKIKN